MLSLSEYQRCMSAALLGSPDAHSSGMTSVALKVHRDTVFNTWMRALRLTFPSASACLPAQFQHLANEFVRAYPPRQPCLHDYADRFPDFVAAHSNLRLSAFLADIARFDLALDRAAQQSMGPHRLSFTIVAGTVLHLNPSVTCLDTRYPVDRVRDAVEAGSPDPLAGLDMTATACRFAIWRGAGGPTVKRLSPCAADFLAALLAGDTVTDAVGVSASGRQHSTELLHAIRTGILTASFAEIVRLPDTGIP